MPAMFAFAPRIAQHPGRLGLGARADPVPHRGDREISACHLLLQRRARRRPRRARSARMAPSPEGRDLRPAAGDVGARGRPRRSSTRSARSGYDLIVVNFANPDMVGHTGILAAAIAACEAVDAGLGAALAALEDVGRRDDRHRRPRQLRDDGRSGHRRAAYRAYREPGAGGARRRAGRARGCATAGGCRDLAPTLLDLLGVPQPPEMTGQSLIVRRMRRPRRRPDRAGAARSPTRPRAPPAALQATSTGSQAALASTAGAPEPTRRSRR